MRFAWLNSQNNPMRKKYYYRSHLAGVETEAQKGWMTPQDHRALEKGACMSLLWLTVESMLSDSVLCWSSPGSETPGLFPSFLLLLPALRPGKVRILFPQVTAVSTTRPVHLPYKEWRGFSVCFERFTSAFPRERLHADVSVGQMFHFFHCPLQRNSGNCQDWFLAATQLPYGDPEWILESLTQASAPASAVPEAVNSMTASSGSKRRWPRLAELPLPTGRSGAVTMVSTPNTSSSPTCGCGRWWPHLLLQGTDT